MKTLFIILLISFPLMAQKLEPGTWKSQSRVKLNGFPLPSENEANCITKDELKNPKQTIEEALEKNKCKLTKWSMKKNNVSASVICDNDDFKASGVIAGNFSKKSYDLEGEASGVHDIIGKTRAEIKLTGEWTGACESKKK